MDSMDAAVGTFFTYCKYEKNLSSKTLKFYQIDLKQFRHFIISQKYSNEIDLITKEICKKYIQHISQFKPKTIKRKIATLKALCNYLEYEDISSQNPFRKIKLNLKEPKLLPKTLDKNELSKLLSYVYETKAKCIPDTYAQFLCLRNIVIVELLFATGIRVSELTGINLTDINLINGKLKIYGKGSKERIISITNPDVVKAIKQYLDLRSSFTMHYTNSLLLNRIGAPISDQSVRLIIKKCSVNANISKKITPHMFRHTFATLLLENDVDIKYIQSFLGHSSILTTQIYTHASEHKKHEILKKKHPRNQISVHHE